MHNMSFWVLSCIKPSLWVISFLCFFQTSLTFLRKVNHFKWDLIIFIQKQCKKKSYYKLCGLFLVSNQLVVMVVAILSAMHQKTKANSLFVKTFLAKTRISYVNTHSLTVCSSKFDQPPSSWCCVWTKFQGHAGEIETGNCQIASSSRD